VHISYVSIEMLVTYYSKVILNLIQQY